MEVKSITIEGFRGFSEKRTISFAKPNGNSGSGLTVLVGPNNSGKSTVVEAFDTFVRFLKDIPKSARNEKNNGNINIKLEIDSNIYEMSSYSFGGSSVYYKKNEKLIDYDKDLGQIFILSSHRYIGNGLGSGGTADRHGYHSNAGNFRNILDNNNFGNRLRKALLTKDSFDNCLKKVMYNFPKWYLDTDNNGSQYLEFNDNGTKYISSGSGDGIINIFNIVDSLYDSDKAEIIFIDEPEKSLHPALQKRLLELLIEYSQDRQIIITTHSPYFIDWNNIVEDGMKVIRIVNCNNTTEVYGISDDTKNFFKRVINDFHNPHVLGLNATESFFLDDNIIVVEGQDDVLGYQKIFKKYNFNPNASFYGWGAGGFEKIDRIVQFLKEIGYKKIMVIADNDKEDKCKELEIKDEYKDYKFIVIPCKDIKKKYNKYMEQACKEIKKIETIDEQTKKTIEKIMKDIFYPSTYLIEDIKSTRISEKYLEFVDNLIDAVDSYFGHVSYSRVSISKDEQELILKSKIEEIIYNNLDENPITTAINKLEIDEDGGGFGEIIDYKYIDEYTYKVLVEIEEGRGDSSINATLEYIVNLNNKNCNLNNYVINKNTFKNINLNDKG